MTSTNKTPKNITCVLGFDYGKKRIGIATGQTITCSATPCTTLKQVDGNPDWLAIEVEIQQWKPQALIVGMPYHTDGSENKMTSAARQFAYELEKRFKLPVIEINEAFSSQQAEEILKQDIKINKQNKHEIDRMAAAIIVQRWLCNTS
ncbi:Putative pre-16S rRNA nuclease Yqg [hydrothermal vent metagenome]|uniref:Pre-16S rRNA nuclease Yqg n=1 Tax=hydrothermal vent metagenome TaxID=652676 RepID=A0A3B0WRG8_9ZZZZ